MASIFTNGTRFDDELASAETALEKLLDAAVPGVIVDFSPEEADLAGAFIETGLDEEDALDSMADLERTSNVGRPA